MIDPKASSGTRLDHPSSGIHFGEIGEELVQVEVEMREQVHLVDNDGVPGTSPGT